MSQPSCNGIDAGQSALATEPAAECVSLMRGLVPVRAGLGLNFFVVGAASWDASAPSGCASTSNGHTSAQMNAQRTGPSGSSPVLGGDR